MLCNTAWATTTSVDFSIEMTDAVTDSGPSSSLLNWIDTIAAGTATPLLKLQNSNSVVGIAINGVLLFAATSHLNYDAFFP